MIIQLLLLLTTTTTDFTVSGVSVDNATDSVDYTKGAFPSLDSIFEVFNLPQYKNISEVQSLLDMFDRQCQFQSGKKYMRNRHRNLFIVIEGTPGSGSRYFSMKLMKSLAGTYIMSPPNSFQVFRQFFDTQDFLLRSAFYGLGNYIVAELVKRNYFFKPVVVNRYWQSHAAMSLTKEAMQGKGLPPRDSPLYRWPRDLLVPDIIFFLTKAQIVHNPMVAGSRGAMNKQFVELLTENYIRMRDPPVIDVDGGAFKTKTYVTLTTLTNMTQQHLRDTYDAMGFFRPSNKQASATL